MTHSKRTDKAFDGQTTVHDRSARAHALIAKLDSSPRHCKPGPVNDREKRRVLSVGVIFRSDFPNDLTNALNITEACVTKALDGELQVYFPCRRRNFHFQHS